MTSRVSRESPRSHVYIDALVVHVARPRRRRIVPHDGHDHARIHTGIHELTLHGASEGVEGRPGEAGPVELAPHRLSRRDGDRKSTRLNSSHVAISYAVFCLKKKKGLACSCASAVLPKSASQFREAKLIS